MCQLLGMNANVPTDICFSFEGFCARGGKTDEHTDGWGIAFFEGPGCRLFLDDKPSVDSAIAHLVRHYPIHSTNVIAHIRKATQGPVALENTQPFLREMWGSYWIFAHNGDLKDCPESDSGFYLPVGTTDSEKAFCMILETLRRRFPDGKPSGPQLAGVSREVSAGLAAKGTFNYVLSNGQVLFAHCSTELSYILRRAPFATAHLIDEDLSVDFSKVTTPNDKVAVIATAPLTDNETWIPIPPGEMVAFCDGEPMAY